MTLADLKRGQLALIKSIDTRHSDVIRLMKLGLIEDVPVRLRNSAIGGDPMEIDFLGSSLSIRREQAQFFEVDLQIPDV
jgi:Fe2+ transport system protein FeoA